MVEYYCSTGDHCGYNYIVNQALVFYTNKTCENFQINLILLLHSNPSSLSRSCLSNNGNITICNQPCEFIFINPNQTLHACYNQRSLEFPTTSNNKPKYNYPLHSYACTTESCNGFEKRQGIDQLIKLDNGKCLMFL